MDNKLIVGQSVVVKEGITEPDFGFDMGGWEGRIIEFVEPEEDDEEMVGITWDCITLKNFPDEYIMRCEEEGIDYFTMYLYSDQVRISNPRDTEADTNEIKNEIKKRFFWVTLKEQHKRIKKVLKGADYEKTGSALQTWNDYLLAKLNFPFKAEIIHLQSDETPVKTGNIVEIISLCDTDEVEGIIAEVANEATRTSIPLHQLAVVDKESENYFAVNDICVWWEDAVN